MIIPWLHLFPVHPARHIQTKSFTMSTHVAFLLQGLGLHSSISENKGIFVYQLIARNSNSIVIAGLEAALYNI